MEALRTMPSFARRSNLLRALFLGAGCGQGPSSVTTNYVNSFLTVSRLPHVLCPPLFLSIINRVQNIVRTGFGRYDKKSSCSIVEVKNRKDNRADVTAHAQTAYYHRYSIDINAWLCDSSQPSARFPGIRRRCLCRL
jgi:hypothetical protein